MTNTENFDKALQAVKRASRVQPPANMYARVMAAIERKKRDSGWDKAASFVLRPAFFIPCLIVVLLLNVWMFSSKKNTQINFAVEDYTSSTYVSLNSENVLP